MLYSHVHCYTGKTPSPQEKRKHVGLLGALLQTGGVDIGVLCESSLGAGIQKE